MLTERVRPLILGIGRLLAFVVCTIAILLGLFEVLRAIFHTEWQDAAVAFVIVSVIYIARRSLHWRWLEIGQIARAAKAKDTRAV